MEENNKTFTVESPAVNLFLFLILVALIFIGVYVFKSYNELTAIHEILDKNTLLH